MNIDKAKKRIAKILKKENKGYPKISLEYFGETAEIASQVVVTFTLEEGSEPQEQRITSKVDAREDEVIQSVLVKIIERSEANSVIAIEGVTLI